MSSSSGQTDLPASSPAGRGEGPGGALPGEVTAPDRLTVTGEETGMPARELLRAGLMGGLVAGVVMALVLMSIAEVSAEPTAVRGIASSTWTPLTAITSFFFGPGAFASSFELLSIAFGALWHLLNAVLAGLIGAALIVWLLGPRPQPFGAMVVGLLYGLCVQIVALSLTVNAVEDPNSVYQALPGWGWWVAHGAFGATLGLALTQRERS
ncbi:MAG TPA: hypothetical protein VGV40_13395 [Solirubrobacteraceae bacterium]|nr:hypothetical protein [Solirubrobacteraceae bacterium]